MKSFRTKVLALPLILLLISFFVAPVYALTSGGVGGYPANPDPGVQYSDSWFIYNLDAGESKQDQLLLQNSSNEAQTIKLYAVDSVATGDGNFALRDERDPREGIGAWIELDEHEVTLKPGEERRVNFTITIPKEVSVGEHSGGIILQKVTAPSVVTGQTGASIITRIGIRVYETVPGELVKDLAFESFAVQEVTAPDKKPMYRIDLAVNNKSNVSLKATASLQIAGWGKIEYFPNSEGLNIDFSDFTNFFKGETLTNEWQLLRGQKVETNWEWPKPRFGRYVFRAVVQYDGENGPESIVSDPIALWVIPWTELGVLGGIIVLLAAWMFLQRRRSTGRGWQDYRVKPGDQLGTIAAAAGISWKKLAAVNHLKSPTVTPGQVIKVPAAMPVQREAVRIPQQMTPMAAPAVTAAPVRPVTAPKVRARKPRTTGTKSARKPRTESI